MTLFNSSFCSPTEKLRFVDYNDPILDVRCSSLTEEEIKDPAMQKLFDGMFAFARGEQSDQQKHVLVGLAAPQIGKDIRVILVDTKADGKGGVSELRLYINPEILEFSQETEEWYEGCFSTGNVKGIVKRPRQVKIKAMDREGHEICETHSGYVARIFQHEIDHLDGIRFPERVPSQDRLHIVKADEMYAYRNQQGWKHWKETISQKDWKEYMR
jgi:peptide deformylase